MMNKINTILFDLDGTLLPIDMKKFEELYFKGLSARFTDLMTPTEFVTVIWSATKAMVNDLNLITNEQAFMQALEKTVQEQLPEYQRRFTEYYESDFDLVRNAVIETAEIHEAVETLKHKGYSLVIATNPMFPKLAIDKRIEWAGIDRNDFIYVSSFEDNHFCKPQIEFYREILTDIRRTPEECIMVGNDMAEDMISGQLGITTYCITNHLLNKYQLPDTSDHSGTYADFLEFVNQLPFIN